ncbi:MAG TPA: fluoride efflux transporter CrcB [Lacunisphaera sp.]|jgi:CrcB protein|nr:fluoride efflux transporter CrcB [Lacunisphaera sp.]
MNIATLGWIALGGALGSVGRALVGLSIQGRFPLATMVVNVTGSLLIGWLMARLGPADTASAASLRSFLVVGVCGGFTTFSAFSWQTLEQMMKGQWAAAVANVLLSVVLCLLATWLGFRLGRA